VPSRIVAPRFGCRNAEGPTHVYLLCGISESVRNCGRPLQSKSAGAAIRSGIFDNRNQGKPLYDADKARISAAVPTYRIWQSNSSAHMKAASILRVIVRSNQNLAESGGTQ
jgi:hypothetical protein